MTDNCRRICYIVPSVTPFRSTLHIQGRQLVT